LCRHPSGDQVESFPRIRRGCNREFVRSGRAADCNAGAARIMACVPRRKPANVKRCAAGAGGGRYAGVSRADAPGMLRQRRHNVSCYRAIWLVSSSVRTAA